MKILPFLAALLCLMQVSPALLSYWRLTTSGLVGDNLARGVTGGKELAGNLSADLNGDGGNECLSLRDGRASLSDCGTNILWASPAQWQVREAFLADLNNDGTPEMVLLVWRAFQDWPIDRFLPHGGRINSFHDSHGKSCQVVLVGWNGKKYDELWAGSALVRPVSQLMAADLDGDGKQELIALEGAYDSEINGGSLTVWRWHGFGFVLVDEVKKQFSNVHVVTDGEVDWVIAQ